ncbi:MAG TPA: hypothetical protein VHW43_01785 [Puia sp.]|nr:hypothetical protein [Puia sp.]
MKTSNKLMFAALVLTLALLTWYDLRLKAEYLSGRYKNPYSGFTKLNYTGFDIVELPSSTAANVKFVQGPFSVRVDNNALDYVVFKQQANRLAINAVFERNYRWNPNPYVIVISCPTLSKLITDASYRANNRMVTDTIVREDWNMRRVLIEGFRQDSLSIEQDYGSTVVLSGDSIRSLRAVIGKSAGSGSKIILKSGNEFREAALDIGHYSKFFLENASIQNLSYHLADSAELILTGNAQHLLHQTKLYQP